MYDGIYFDALDEAMDIANEMEGEALADKFEREVREHMAVYDVDRETAEDAVREAADIAATDAADRPGRR